MAKRKDTPTEHVFKVSTGLKDLIGRELITDDFVAVFELVKNSFDAHANSVHLIFDEDRITISDNGKGMSRNDILDKWLFVAYSAKRDGTEDVDYRDRIEDRNRPFAGAKGVGRFSCDRLGRELVLSSKSKASPVQNLLVNWTDFERDHLEEFSNIGVKLWESTDYPDPASRKMKGGTISGTTLEIKGLRTSWDRDKLKSLKRELSKLIDPFSGTLSRFSISISAPAEKKADAIDRQHNEELESDDGARLLVNGPVTNPIIDVLATRTTSIEAVLSDDGKSIESTLEDRGQIIYKIRETNPYPLLELSQIRASLYFLNRSAKYVFARRMGLPSVQFGSVFLFRNGFRIFPIGAEEDDFFGLNRRKQQGQRRFLGGRDLIGRVDIHGAEGFDEATSRNQGLIRTPNVEELIDFVRDKCVKRLERYVVDITWKDTFDKDLETPERMLLDQSSARISQLVSKLAATEGVDLVHYNPDIVRIVDEKSQEFESSLRALELLADRTGDENLLAKVDQARARLAILEAAEKEAREAEQRAEARAARAESAAATAEAKYSSEVERNKFLVAASTLDQDTILNLHHQIIIHAADVHNEIKLLLTKIRTGSELTTHELSDALERIFYRNSQILTAAKFATKGGYKQQSSEISDNLPLYIQDYVDSIASLWSRKIAIRAEWDGTPFTRKFKPIDIGILIDNITSNAEKNGASAITLSIRVIKGARGTLEVNVTDDGDGWPDSIKPLERIFEKGVTSKTTGSGLGLFHVRQIIEGMGGTIEALAQASADNYGAHLRMRLPQ